MQNEIATAVFAATSEISSDEMMGFADTVNAAAYILPVVAIITSVIACSGAVPDFFSAARYATTVFSQFTTVSEDHLKAISALSKIFRTR